MGDQDQFTRRRLLLGTAAGIAASTVGADSTTADATHGYGKISKAAALYRNRPRGGQRCGLCRHFRGPDGCTRVAGRISPYGWCRLWAPRTRMPRGGRGGY
jgi:hypothetical protein